MKTFTGSMLAGSSGCGRRSDRGMASTGSSCTVVEYFAFLKQVITDKQSQKRKVNAFPTEYSRYHSQEQVSQLLL